MLKPIRLAAVLLLGIALLTATGSPLSQMVAAARPSGTSPILVAAESYSVLGYSTVTNTGPTTVTGDLGVYPGSAVTGFPPGIVNSGTIHAGDAHAAAAQADNAAAFGFLDQPCDFTYPDGQNLADLSPLVPGVYCALGSFALTGNLTLTGSSGAWIFKSSSTLTTASGSSVTGGDPCNVWWRVGSSATLGTASEFRGNILAFASITLTSGANLNGRALAQNGAVTLDTNNTYLSCPVSPTATVTATSAVTPTSTATATHTPSATATHTPSATATRTPTAALTQTGTPTTTATATVTGAPTNTPTPTATMTSTATPTLTATPTTTSTPTPTSTPPPTAVELLYFMVSWNGQTVVLNWATAAEIDNYGFNLYRAPVDNFSLAQRIHFEPSAIQGGTGSGATYRYPDMPPVQGTWWYWLADVDTQGIETVYTPSVAIALQFRTQIYLPWIGKR